MNLRNFTIYDLFKRSARLYKGEIALLFDGQGITFGELFDQINALTGWFGSRGIAKGDRIVVLSRNCPQFFTLMGSIAALGAIMVPINFRLSTDEMKYIFSDIEPVMLFFDPEFEQMIIRNFICLSVIKGSHHFGILKRKLFSFRFSPEK